MKIQVLSEEMASRIAAGEVVERPASVVKELIENALDAQATEVSVWLEKSGTSMIRVSDNGEGMAPEDLSLAVERHSTSKIKEEADLFRIATLGFRGEALPSIASVSKMEIRSRLRSSKTGYRLRIEGGNKDRPCVTASSPGTTVEIKDIFFNTPARRKFLKSPSTELSHICDVVNRMAIAFPAVHFRLYHDGRTLGDYAAVNDAKDRLQQVLGREVVNGLISYSWNQKGLEVSGYLSAAPVSYPNSRYLLTFVNRRYVRDRTLTHGVIQGYETLLMKGRYPAAVLFLDISFDAVDVNVHPAKYEVRFRQPSDVHDAVAQAIREALKGEAKGPLPKMTFTQPQPFTGVNEPTLPYAKPGVSYPGSIGRMETFPATSETAPAEGFFSSMTVIGQILGCYLVCFSSHGLALIDQHAAHERIAFEKMRRELETGGVQRQNLLIPQTLELPAAESVLLERKLDALAHFGFILEPFGPDTFAITAAPALLPEGDYREVIKSMVAELAELEKSSGPRQHLEERLATIACHSVIRANRKLEIGEMRALLKELDQVDFATQCPHGRPVLLEFGRDDLERMFKRV